MYTESDNDGIAELKEKIEKEKAKLKEAEENLAKSEESDDNQGKHGNNKIIRKAKNRIADYEKKIAEMQKKS